MVIEHIEFRCSYHSENQSFSTTEDIDPAFINEVNALWQKNGATFPLFLKKTTLSCLRVSNEQAFSVEQGKSFKILFSPVGENQCIISVVQKKGRIATGVNTDTATFRFPQLYLHLFEMPCVMNPLVLILGLGYMPISEGVISLPQLTEVEYVYRAKGASPTLFIADAHQEVLEKINRSQHHYSAFLLNSVLDRNGFGARKEYIDLVSQMCKQTVQSSLTSAVWDPIKTESPFPHKMHAIIATRSVFFGMSHLYFDGDHQGAKETLRRLLGALAIGGTLYIDVHSIKPLSEDLLVTPLFYELEIDPTKEKFVVDRLQTPSEDGHVYFGKASSINTGSLVAITRCLPEHLSIKLALFTKYDRKNYWHTLVKEKTKFNENYASHIKKLGSDSFNALSEGLTPLHVAVLSNNRAGIEFLLKHGADPTIAAEGKTPIDFAREFFPDLLQYFSSVPR